MNTFIVITIAYFYIQYANCTSCGCQTSGASYLDDNDGLLYTTCATCNNLCLLQFSTLGFSSGVLYNVYDCLTCDTVYGLGCKTCSNVMCLTCDTQAGYYMFTNICLTCTNIQLNCLTCTIASCTTCDQANGYFKSFLNLCQSCSQMYGPQCNLCTSNPPQCTACNSGYYFDLFANQCQSCGGLTSNCLLCTNTLCTGCDQANGYFKSSLNLCQSCSQMYGPQCTSCTSNPPECSNCASGYFYDKSINQCTSCSNLISNCLLCTNISCTSCNQPNGYFKSSTGFCKLCTQIYGSKCLSCASLPAKCSTCASEYYYDDISTNLCMPCPSPCLQCLNSPTHCTSCINDNQKYYLDSVNHVCKLCSDKLINCFSCAIDGLTCVKCNSPLYCLDSTQGTCQKLCQTGSKSTYQDWMKDMIIALIVLVVLMIIVLIAIVLYVCKLKQTNQNIIKQSLFFSKTANLNTQISQNNINQYRNTNQCAFDFSVAQKLTHLSRQKDTNKNKSLQDKELQQKATHLVIDHKLGSEKVQVNNLKSPKTYYSSDFSHTNLNETYQTIQLVRYAANGQKSIQASFQPFSKTESLDLSKKTDEIKVRKHRKKRLTKMDQMMQTQYLFVQKVGNQLTEDNKASVIFGQLKQ